MQDTSAMYIDIGYPPWPGEFSPSCSWDPRPRLRGWWWWQMLAQLYRLSRIHLQSGHFSLYSLLPPPVTEELQCWCSEDRSWVVVAGCIGIGSGGDTWPCSFLAPPALWRIAITRRTAPWDSGQPLHEEATLKLQIANNKGEAGVHLLNSGSFHSSGTQGSQFECLHMMFVCCCVLCMCDSAASCWSWQMAPAPSTSTYWPLHCSGTSHQPTSPVTLISALPDFWEETLSPSTI